MDILDEFRELAEVSSPSKDERRIAELLKRKLTEMGLTVTEDNVGVLIGGTAGNLTAVLPASGGVTAEPLLLAAHMDRVPEGDGIRIVDHGEYFSSDGSTILAADDLSGVCAILDGLRRVLSGGRPHGEVEILFTVCEELKTQGARNLDYKRLKSKSGYCIDSSGRFGRVITGAPSIDRLYLTVTGKKAHAGAEPEKGIDALKAAATVIAEIREGRLDAETTSNFGVIRAGSVTNVICDKAELQGEVRSRSPEKVEEYERYAEQVIADVCGRFGAQYSFTVEHDMRAFSVPEHTRTVEKLLAAIRKAGGEGYTEAGGGGMDANHFNEHGIESVGVAAGYLKNHTREEVLYKDDLRKAGKMVEELICAWASDEQPAAAT